MVNFPIQKYIIEFILMLLCGFFGNYKNEYHNIFEKFLMGLFDNFSHVKAKKNTDLSPTESFAGIMLATIAADGYLANEEIQTLVATFIVFRYKEIFGN